MIIDAHVHWLPKEVAENTSFYKKGWSDDGFLLEFLDKNEIDKAVVTHPTTDAHTAMGHSEVATVYNENIAQLQERSGARFLCLGVVDISSVECAHESLAMIKKFKLSGVNLASSYEGVFLVGEVCEMVYDFCEKEKLPIFIHTQTINPIGFERVKDPLLMPALEFVFDLSVSFGVLMMEGVLTKHPNLKIVFPSLAGSIVMLKDRFDGIYQMLRKRGLVKDIGANPSEFFKKIYVDTTGIYSGKILEVAKEVFDENKILWGSDFPANQNIGKSLSIFDGESQKEKFVYKNVVNLFEEVTQ